MKCGIPTSNLSLDSERSVKVVISVQEHVRNPIVHDCIVILRDHLVTDMNIDVCVLHCM